MNTHIEQVEVLFTPAEFSLMPARDLRKATCVVFDILRATTSMIEALGNGALAIEPVTEIAEAVAHYRSTPEVLLAGERNGLRISSIESGGPDFRLGNSPREFTSDVVTGRNIVMTTTNGTRALQACRNASQVLPCSFRNLKATSDWIVRHSSHHLIIVCAGTFEEAALEDTLAAGALVDSLMANLNGSALTDAGQIAHQLFQLHQHDLLKGLSLSRNGQKLLGNPDLRDDVAFAAQLNASPLVAAMRESRVVRIA